MFIFTNERYKTYQMGILFCRLGHALGVGLRGAYGSKIKFRPYVCPLCYLLHNQLTKSNQICCVSYSHEWGAQRQFLAPPPGALERGQKFKKIKFNYKVNFKDFFSQMKDTKHIRRVFILLPGSCPRCGTLGRWGCPGGHFFQTWSCGISNRRGDEQNRMQVNFSPFEWGQKLNIIKFQLPCQF